jgi:hypothetical protein
MICYSDTSKMTMHAKYLEMIVLLTITSENI